jgi:hypothetical protein
MLLNEIVRANESSRRPARGNGTDRPARDQYWTAAVSRNWNREYSRPRAMRNQRRIKSEGRAQKNKMENEDPEQRLWLTAGKQSPDSGTEPRASRTGSRRARTRKSAYEQKNQIQNKPIKIKEKDFSLNLNKINTTTEVTALPPSFD